MESLSSGKPLSRRPDDQPAQDGGQAACPTYTLPEPLLLTRVPSLCFRWAVAVGLSLKPIRPNKRSLVHWNRLRAEVARLPFQTGEVAGSSPAGAKVL
jgi:hypothetical protein